LTLGDIGDLDGGLLTITEKFDGGFEWGENGEVKLLINENGFGIKLIS